MATASISATAATSRFSNLDAESRMPARTLDQDDFLKLLVAQMTSQDPLNPTSDLTSISQMASFSALEQSKATQASMAMIQANSMLGHFVEVTDELGHTTFGQVEQVLMVNGEPQLIVEGERFPLNRVAAISVQPLTPGGDQAGGSAPEATPRLGPPPRFETEPTLGPAPGGGESSGGATSLAHLEALLRKSFKP